jgi:phosphoribosylformylglycinamidine synthase
VPKLDVEHALAIYRAMSEATNGGLLCSSHTPTLGGLAAACALAAIGGDLGAEIDLSALACEGGLDDDARLFSESNSRFVITCTPENAAPLEALFRGLPCGRVGRVMGDRRLRITGKGGRTVVDADVDALRRAFKETLYGI